MFLLPLTLARQSFLHSHKYLPVVVATALIHQHAMHAPITNYPVTNDWRMTFDNRLGGGRCPLVSLLVAKTYRLWRFALDNDPFGMYEAHGEECLRTSYGVVT